MEENNSNFNRQMEKIDVTLKLKYKEIVMFVIMCLSGAMAYWYACPRQYGFVMFIMFTIVLAMSLYVLYWAISYYWYKTATVEKYMTPNLGFDDGIFATNPNVGSSPLTWPILGWGESGIYPEPRYYCTPAGVAKSPLLPESVNCRNTNPTAILQSSQQHQEKQNAFYTPWTNLGPTNEQLQAQASNAYGCGVEQPQPLDTMFFSPWTERA